MDICIFFIFLFELCITSLITQATIEQNKRTGRQSVHISLAIYDVVPHLTLIVFVKNE